MSNISDLALLASKGFVLGFTISVFTLLAHITRRTIRNFTRSGAVLD